MVSVALMLASITSSPKRADLCRLTRADERRGEGLADDRRAPTRAAGRESFALVLAGSQGTVREVTQLEPAIGSGSSAAPICWARYSTFSAGTTSWTR